VTGYNHYSDCTCGWCVNYGRGKVTVSVRRLDAWNLLSRNAVRSVAACFVNPNARCPVCRAPVFFYANEFGSRVFFDDLGPSWPKHSCTDNSRRPEISSFDTSAAPPTRRARGLTRELIDAANVAGIFRGKVFGNKRPHAWTLHVVTSMHRRGDQNDLEADCLESSDGAVARFNCRSVRPILEVGDYISIREKEVSFLYKELMIPVQFAFGGIVPLGDPPKSTTALPASRSSPLFSRNPRLIRQSASSRSDGMQFGLPRPARAGGEIKPHELKHFQTKARSVDQFCAILSPIVRALAREGKRKPHDVAFELNLKGRRTACGDKWTPRLTYILLSRVFNDSNVAAQARELRAIAKDRRERSDPRKRTFAGAESSSMLTEEELAKRRDALKQAEPGRRNDPSNRQKNPVNRN
jgi:hypothetical protein